MRMGENDSKEYESEPVNLAIKALSCFLEKTYYTHIKCHKERVFSIKLIKILIKENNDIFHAHKKLLQTFWNQAEVIEVKCHALYNLALNNGLPIQHHDDLYPFLIDGYLMHGGRHILDDNPDCMSYLLDGIRFTFENSHCDFFSVSDKPNIKLDSIPDTRLVIARKSQILKTNFLAINEPSNTDKVNSAIEKLKKLNLLVGGPGYFKYANFPINTNHPHDFSDIALQELLDNALIICFDEHHEQQTRDYFSQFKVVLTEESIRHSDPDKRLSTISTEKKRWLLCHDPLYNEIRVCFPDIPFDARLNEARRLFSNYLMEMESFKEARTHSFKSQSKQRARIRLLQGIDRAHLFSDANGRTNICLDLLLRIQQKNTLKMPRKVGDYARFTVSELYQREIYGNPNSHALDLILIYQSHRMHDQADYLVEFQFNWLRANQNITHQLQGACRLGHFEMAKHLVSLGADINKESTNLLWQPGTTAFNEAIKSGNKELVKFLLSKGADVKLKTTSSITPFDVAFQYHQMEIATWLTDYI